MKKYFVTATGTNIGKTFITAALTKQLRTKGKNVIVLKPVISGFHTPLAQTDTGLLLKAQELPITKENIDAISPWRFTDAISPDMAAENEKKKIPFDELVAFSKKQKADYLLIEGPGGVMTPLDKSHTVLDWMATLGFEVILISGSYLGTLSHTLTAYHAIAAKKLKIHCVIINESGASPAPLKRTVLTLKRFLPNDTIYPVTRNRVETIKRIKL